MSMLRWTVLGAVAIGFAGVRLLGGQAAFSAGAVATESTRYLVENYRAAPSRLTAIIKRHTSACLVERIGKEASTDLANFFGEIMVYTVRNIDKDRQAFVSGYRALAERDGPAIDGRIAALPRAEKQRIAALVEDFADGPNAMVDCVARKLGTSRLNL
jgi:hypothetical protein